MLQDHKILLPFYLNDLKRIYSLYPYLTISSEERGLLKKIPYGTSQDSKIESYRVRELTQFVYCFCTVLATSLGGKSNPQI